MIKMKTDKLSSTIIISIIALTLFHNAHAQIQEPVIRAVRVASAPIIDGLLTDSCWQQCDTATNFYMLEPNPGAAVTQPTYVHVCYDDEKIYFGVHMSEAKPEAIQAVTTRRDGDVYMDDCFELILDTYCDRRNGYYLASNLLGTKLDGRIIDNGRSVEANWDGNWETKAQLVPDGWEIEMAIPFSELSYPSKDSINWGINFWRTERPHWENTSWSNAQSWCQISRYGTLTGLCIEAKTKRFELLPYVAARYDLDSLEPRAGIDFEYDITSSLIFNATLLPDFAQIEADPLKFNFSYEEGEELYFAEKRPFFLEGGDILSTPLQLFYTRRMNEILAGAKLYGKIHNTEVLALDVQTKDTEANFSVLRAKQEISSTTIGVLATHKARTDTVSQAAAFDLGFPVAGPFLFTSQFATTNNTGITGDRWAGMVGVGGETSTYGAGLEVGRMGKDFWIEQGFVNVYDINRQGVEGWARNRFLNNKTCFQYVDFVGSFEVQQEIGNDLALAGAELRANFVAKSRLRLSIVGMRGYERYGDTEFENHNIQFEIETNVGGATGFSSILAIGELYDEPHKFFHFGFLAQPLRRVTIFPIFQARQWGAVKWHWLTNSSITYQMTDRAFLRAYLRAESNSGTSSEQDFALEEFQSLSANFLFGYEFAPRTMLYLVYNQQRTFDPDSTIHIFVTKFTYSFRF